MLCSLVLYYICGYTDTLVVSVDRQTYTHLMASFPGQPG